MLGFTIVYTFFLSSNLFIPYVATLFNFIKGGHCCLIHFFFAFFVAWHGSAKLKLLTQLRRQREQPGLLLEWRRPVLEAVQKVMQRRIVMKQKKASRAGILAPPQTLFMCVSHHLVTLPESFYGGGDLYYVH